MKIIGFRLLIATITTGSQLVLADVTDFNNSPNNFENSPNNFENSPNNFANSPLNFENNTNRVNNSRVIRDNEGNATGYAVPKSNGGVNYFDSSGHRTGYQPADE